MATAMWMADEYSAEENAAYAALVVGLAIGYAVTEYAVPEACKREPTE